MFILLTLKNHQALLLNLESTWNISTEALIARRKETKWGPEASSCWALYTLGSGVPSGTLLCKRIDKGDGHYSYWCIYHSTELWLQSRLKADSSSVKIQIHEDGKKKRRRIVTFLVSSFFLHEVLGSPEKYLSLYCRSHLKEIRCQGL